jgi:hypothetical protein
VVLERDPPPLYSIDHVLDPFQETPESKARFEIAKWGLRLPLWGEGEEEPSFLEEREIRQIAHFVVQQDKSKEISRKVRSIFITSEGVDDPRAAVFREKIRADYEGVVLRDKLPPGRTFQIGVPTVLQLYPWWKMLYPRDKSLLGCRGRG